MPRIGFFQLIQINWDRLCLKVLEKYFKFDSWHSSAPFSSRPYKKTVVDIVNDLKINVVVEVGSGLGELLVRIKAKERYGYDIDLGAVRASRFLYGKYVSFFHGDSKFISQEKIDVLIMVNWIHNLSPKELEDILMPMTHKVKYFLLDAIDLNGPKTYRYKHDFKFFGGVAELLSVTPAPNEPRSFHLFRVKK